MAELKQCSYCAEDIKTAAIVCKHCGRELPGYLEKAPQVQIESDASKQIGESKSINKVGNSQDSPDENLLAMGGRRHKKVADLNPATNSNHWRVGRRVGVVIAILSFVLIGGSRLIRLSEYSGLAFRAGLSDAIFGAVAAAIANFVVFTVLTALFVWLWRSQRNLLYVLIGILLLFIGYRTFPNNVFEFLSNSPPGANQIANQSSPTNQPSTINGCPEGCTTHLSGCDIKGNISQNTGSKIYHLPGQEFYEITIIFPSSGERWFCSEEEAIQNGWRKAESLPPTKSAVETFVYKGEVYRVIEYRGETCIYWDDVREISLDGEICIFGRLNGGISYDDDPPQYYFTQTGMMGVWIQSTFNTPLEARDCVVANAVVKAFPGFTEGSILTLFFEATSPIEKIPDSYCS